MAKRTVYIIGAGASYEAKLPTGNQLKNQIAKLLDVRYEFGRQKSGDYEIQRALEKLSVDKAHDLNSYIHECQHISKNMPLAISIDNFIDTDRSNEKLALCGKLAIIKSILDAEKSSSLYFDSSKGQSNIDFMSLENTWYLSFFRTLTENCNTEELAERFDGITLVIFNYDRCVEHFLLHALMSTYRLSITQAAELVLCLDIIHPYGTVGSLEWEDSSSSTSIKFGGELSATQLVDYAQSIRTFTEGSHSEYMSQLRLAMRYTERLVFLGFAFHRLNMELIGGDSMDKYDNSQKIECYATAFETSKSDQESMRNSINYLYDHSININIENTTCSQLFRDYSRSLGYS